MPSSPRQYKLMCSFCMLGVACITRSCGCMQMSVYACVFVRVNVGSEAHPWLTSVTGALLFRMWQTSSIWQHSLDSCFALRWSACYIALVLASLCNTVVQPIAMTLQWRCGSGRRGEGKGTCTVSNIHALHPSFSCSLTLIYLLHSGPFPLLPGVCQNA